MHRMRRHEQKQQGVCHQDKAFNRVHCQAGPRSRVDVLVMPGMHMAIHEPDMEDPVVRVKIETRPDRDQDD